VAAVTARGEVPQAELAQLASRALRRLVTVPAGEAGTGRPVAGAIDRLLADGRLARDGGRLRDAARARPSGPSDEVLAAMAALERALDAPAPPPLADAARAAGCPPAGIRQLESANRIVRLGDDLAYAATAFAALETRALELAGRGPLTPAAFRDATGTSRKYVMAILEELDRRGVLRRTPDGHVPGPRAGIATQS
jgi:selenocysteine-specific elongation factor